MTRCLLLNYKALLRITGLVDILCLTHKSWALKFPEYGVEANQKLLKQKIISSHFCKAFWGPWNGSQPAQPGSGLQWLRVMLCVPQKQASSHNLGNNAKAHMYTHTGKNYSTDCMVGGRNGKLDSYKQLYFNLMILWQNISMELWSNWMHWILHLPITSKTPSISCFF